MQIISWNVNGLRAAAGKGFTAWLEQAEPDILCLQETKAEPGQLPDEIKSPHGKSGAQYKSVWASAKKRGYSGTAIYYKQEPLDVTYSGVAEFDDEGRVVKAIYKDFTVISAYFPNSQDAGARLDYKLRFCDMMFEQCTRYVKEKKHFVLCGDYNIAHKPIDLARPADNEDSPGYLPEERAWMDKFTTAGFVDTFRHFYPDKSEAYSWWSYRTRARERNVGWRLDYCCIDPALLPRLQSAEIYHDVEGSDHCPVGIDLDNVD